MLFSIHVQSVQSTNSSCQRVKLHFHIWTDWQHFTWDVTCGLLGKEIASDQPFISSLHPNWVLCCPVYCNVWSGCWRRRMTWKNIGFWCPANKIVLVGVVAPCWTNSIKDVWKTSVSTVWLCCTTTAFSSGGSNIYYIIVG